MTDVPVKNFNGVNFTDYGTKMPDLDFEYDSHYHPIDSELPDPQKDPIIPGAAVPIQKVGIGRVDLPVLMYRRDGEVQTLQAEASLYCSVDDPNAKGLNLSRVYLTMHKYLENHISITGIRDVLQEQAEKQGSKTAYCKLRFKYPWFQEALRSREPLTEHEEHTGEFDTLYNGEKISKRKLHGHIAYHTELEGQYHDGEYKFFLTVDYIYSSTCPCSFELANDARENRGKAANAHSQRSVMKVTVEFDPENIVWIEDLIELCREHIPTEVQIVVKRRDEQAFAELNGANLLFSEDAVRIMYQALDHWCDIDKIRDFRVVASHEESLHPWSAIAVIYKGVDGGLR